MKRLGTFQSNRWGTVEVIQANYLFSTAIAIQLERQGEPLAKLSVNMVKPDASHGSADLPADCFYAKCWEENEELAAEALASGLFVQRDDLPVASSGFVTAPAWQIVAAGSAS